MLGQSFNIPNTASNPVNWTGVHSFQYITTRSPRVDVTFPSFAADRTGQVDMTASFTAAINFAVTQQNLSTPPQSTNGGMATVYLPAGTYLLSNKVYVPGGMKIVGDATGATTILVPCDNAAGAGSRGGLVLNGTQFIGTFYSDTTLENISVRGSGHCTTSDLVEVYKGIHIILNHVNLGNSGGRCLNIQGDGERVGGDDITITNCRWPAQFVADNESYFNNLKIIGAGQDDSGFCWGDNCIAGVYPASGVIIPDSHYALYATGQNISVDGCSAKPLNFENGFEFLVENGTIKNCYFEGFPFSGQPRINHSVRVGGHSETATLTSGITATATTIPLNTVDWFPVYLDSPTNAATLTPQNFLDLTCADANPLSSAPCAADASKQQNDFERIIYSGFASDLSPHGVIRGVSCSRPGLCTSGSGIGAAWVTGVVIRTTNGNNFGSVTLQDNHLEANHGSGSGGYSSNCTLVAFPCGEVTVGNRVEGIETVIPGTGSGFSGNAQSQGYSVQLINNVFRGYGSTPATNSGNVIVPNFGIVYAIQNTTATANIVSSAANIPNIYGGGSYAIQFLTYNSGANVAGGLFVDRNAGVEMSPTGPAGKNSFSENTLGGSSSMPDAGLHFKDSRCWYDLTSTSPFTINRFCFKGQPANTTPVFTQETWDSGGSIWKIYYSSDSVNGINSQVSGAVKIARGANYIQNSANMVAATAGWPANYSITPISSITCGQPDPDGGNNACEVVLNAASANWNYTNTSSSSGPSGSITTCVQLKVPSGTGTLRFDGNVSGNVAPITLANLTTTWQTFQSIGPSASPIHYFRFGGLSTDPAMTVDIYAPATWSGTGCPFSPIITTTSQFNASSYLSAANIFKGTTPLAASTLLTGSGTLTYTAIAAQTAQEQTVTVTSATTSMHGAVCSPLATLGNVNLSWSSWISASNTVSVRLTNPTTGSITPSAVSWGCTVSQ